MTIKVATILYVGCNHVRTKFVDMAANGYQVVARTCPECLKWRKNHVQRNFNASTKEPKK